jgi:ABC-type multidrug transport system permease subunit
MAKKQMTSTNWLLLLIVPQLIFSGSVIPTANISLPFRILSSVNPSRYALDALLRISGYGDGFAAPPMSDWLALAIISLGLIALLMLIQQRAGDRKDMSS